MGLHHPSPQRFCPFQCTLIRLLGLGTVEHHFSRLAAARHVYEEALALQIPLTRYLTLTNLGILCLEMGEGASSRNYFDCAADLCRATLEKTPRLYVALYALALVRVSRSEGAEALATYRRAIGICRAEGVLRLALQDLDLLGRARPSAASIQDARDLLVSAFDGPGNTGGS